MAPGKLAPSTALTSAHNPLIKEIRRAAARATLTRDGACLAEGFHLLDEAIAAHLAIEAVVAVERAAPDVERRLAALDPRPRLLRVDDKLFRELASTEAPQGVLAMVRPPEWSESALFPASRAALVLVLDGVQDPGNAGTLVRAAEGFGATGAIFVKGTVDCFNPKALRAAAGSTFRLPIVSGMERKDALELLRARNVTSYATDVRAGTTLQDARLDEACAIAIGSEAHGVSREWANASTALNIPTTGVESLNAAIAGAVIFYEAQRQRQTNAQRQRSVRR